MQRFHVRAVPLLASVCLISLTGRMICAAEEVPESIRNAVEQLHQPGGADKLLESVNGQSFRDIPYVENGHERQMLDLYVPENESRTLPLVCYIHGGGWRNGNKSRSAATPLITQGYAVASIGYRLTNVAQFPAQIEDCKAAIRWLRANASRFGIDPDRIGVWGQSAGGHLAALLGTSGDVPELEGTLGNPTVSSRVQAVCDVFGPTDFLLSSVGGSPDDPNGPVARLLGGPAPQRPEIARLASPATWISADDPPFLILQGDRDRTVPPDQSETFAAGLKTAGVEAELIVFPGAAHGGPEFQSPETIYKIVTFFDRHLKAPQR